MRYPWGACLTNPTYPAQMVHFNLQRFFVKEIRCCRMLSICLGFSFPVPFAWSPSNSASIAGVCLIFVDWYRFAWSDGWIHKVDVDANGFWSWIALRNLNFSLATLTNRWLFAGFLQSSGFSVVYQVGLITAVGIPDLSKLLPELVWS